MRRHEYVLYVSLLAMRASAADLFVDDFSHPAGWLTSPVGLLNAAIPETSFRMLACGFILYATAAASAGVWPGSRSPGRRLTIGSAGIPADSQEIGCT